MSRVTPQSAGGNPRAELRLDPAAGSVGDARRFLRTTLRGWDADELEWSATQALSELVTNAVLHAGTSVTVSLQLVGDGGLRLEVRDGSRRTPKRRRYGSRATTGRGIALVAGLSRTWGVEPCDDGKTVWCELAATDEPAEPDLSAFLSLDELLELQLEHNRPA